MWDVAGGGMKPYPHCRSLCACHRALLNPGFLLARWWQGKLNAGFYYLMGELPQERLLIAVMGLSAAEAVFELTRKYVWGTSSLHAPPHSHRDGPNPYPLPPTSHTTIPSSPYHIRPYTIPYHAA